MLLVNCRECGALQDSRARRCPDCGALRPGVRFDAESTSVGSVLLGVRNAIVFRLLTLRMAAAMLAVGAVAFMAWWGLRPSQQARDARAALVAAARTDSLRIGLRQRLLRLMVAEEGFYHERGRYGSLEEIDSTALLPIPEISLEIAAAEESYMGTSRIAVPGVAPASCTVRVGADVPPEVAGRLICEGVGGDADSGSRELPSR